MSQVGSFERAHGMMNFEPKAKAKIHIVRTLAIDHTDDHSISQNSPAKLFVTLTNAYNKSEDIEPDNTMHGERFQTKHQYILTLVGKSIGPSNIWRLPMVIYRNGGAIFLYAYIFLTLLLAFPLFFMELSLGQFAGKNTVRTFDFCPALRGVGLLMCLISFIIASYYHVLMAYLLYYFGASFRDPMPWTVCPNDTESCVTDYHDDVHHEDSPKPEGNSYEDDAKIFFRNEMLRYTGKSTGLDYPWLLFLCLFISWLLMTVCMSKVIRFSNKLMYATLFLPMLMLILLINALSVYKYSVSGLKYLFVDLNWKQLGRCQFWADAVGQSLISVGVATGSNILYASYCEFNNKFHIDCAIVTAVNMFTSVSYAVIVFMMLFHRHTIDRFWIENTSDWFNQLSLVLVTFSETVAHMPQPNVWSVIFFVLLYIVFFHSEYAFLETLFAYLDRDSKLIRRHNVFSRIMISVIGFLFGVVLLSPIGPVIIMWLDRVLVGGVLVGIVFLELVAVMGIYGYKRFIEDMSSMLDVELLCLKTTCFIYFVFWLPLITLATFGCYLVYYPLTLLFFLPVILWLLFYIKACYSTWPFQNEYLKFWKCIFQPAPSWVPNNGFNIHRDNTTVFSDIILSLKKKRKLTPVYTGPFNDFYSEYSKREHTWNKRSSLTIQNQMATEAAAQQSREEAEDARRQRQLQAERERRNELTGTGLLPFPDNWTKGESISSPASLVSQKKIASKDSQSASVV